jgi:hypothetical protein
METLFPRKIKPSFVVSLDVASVSHDSGYCNLILNPYFREPKAALKTRYTT